MVPNRLAACIEVIDVVSKYSSRELFVLGTLSRRPTYGHEIIKTVHPHPTMSEAVMEAVAAAYGEVIHI